MPTTIRATTTTDTVPNVNNIGTIPTQPRLSFIPSQNGQIPSNTSYNKTGVGITAPGKDNSNRTTTTIAPLNADTISNVKYNHGPTPHTSRILSQNGPTPTNTSYINARVGNTPTGNVYNNSSTANTLTTTTDTIQNVNYNASSPKTPRSLNTPSHNDPTPSNTSYINARVGNSSTGNARNGIFQLHFR